MSSWILAADIGGTKCNLACFDRQADSGSEPIRQKTYPTADYKNLETIIGQFLGGEVGCVEAACFGMAGPIRDGVCRPTNFPWSANIRDLRRCLNLDRVELHNDLVATAYGLSVLRPDQYAILNDVPSDPLGNAALIAPGTGLGEALMFHDGRRLKPVASEGGHVDFAPTSELEIALLRHLNQEFTRTSVERVVSGPGLVRIYEFLRDTGRGVEPKSIARKMEQGDPSATISRAALAGESPLCEQALDLFVYCMGVEAGNLGLKNMASAGVYLGGGIPPKILPKLLDGTFMRGFTNKGRLKQWAEATPVRVILEPKTALLGAAHYARSLLDPA
jgi:glucokinase